MTTKTLIIPTENLDPDVLASAFSIARAITSKGKSKAEILFEKDKIPPHLLKIFNTKDIRFTSELEPHGFVVRLKSIDAKVKDVKWEEKDGEINLYISADNGKLDRKAIVKSGGTNYEKIITIGIQKLDELGEIYIEHKELFNSLEVVNIDIASNNSHFGKTEFVKPDASSLSEVAFEFLESEGISIGAVEATNLLAGIFWKTQSFKSASKVSTFQAVTELMNANADPVAASRQVYQTLSLNQVRYMSTILKNAEISPDGIVWSIVRKSEINTMKVEEIIFPEVNLLSFFTGAKAAFVLTEIKEQLTHCDLKSNQKSIKASKLAQVFGFRGNVEHSNFYIHNTIENAKIQILNEIRGEGVGIEISEKSELATAKNIERIEDEESPIEDEEYSFDDSDDEEPEVDDEVLNPFKTEDNDEEIADETKSRKSESSPKNLMSAKPYDPLPPAEDGPPPEA